MDFYRVYPCVAVWRPLRSLFLHTMVPWHRGNTNGPQIQVEKDISEFPISDFRFPSAWTSGVYLFLSRSTNCARRSSRYSLLGRASLASLLPNTVRPKYKPETKRKGARSCDHRDVEEEPEDGEGAEAFRGASSVLLRPPLPPTLLPWRLPRVSASRVLAAWRPRNGMAVAAVARRAATI